MNTFIKNSKKIISIHLKLSWKLLIIFSALLFVGVALCIGATSFNNGDYHLSRGYFLRPTQIIASNDSSINDRISEMMNFDSSITTILNNYIYAMPAILLISIFTIIFTNILLSNDLETGKILFWLTSGESRSKIISLKFISLIIINFALTMSIVFPAAIFAAISQDAPENFGMFIGLSIQFVFFNIFITSVLFLICLVLYKQKLISNLCCSFFLLYLVLCYILNLFYSQKIVEDNWLKYVKYFSLNTLLFSPFEYSQNLTIKTEILTNQPVKYLYTVQYELIKRDTYLYVLLPIVVVILTGASYATSHILFKKMDFSI